MSGYALRKKTMKKLMIGSILVMLLLASVSCNGGGDDSSSQKPVRTNLEELLPPTKLVEDNGCLRTEYLDKSFLLILPDGFSVGADEEGTLIIDGDGQTVAHVGDTIQVGGGEVSAGVVRDVTGGRMPGDCQGPYYLVGNFHDVSSPPPESERPEKFAELAEKYKDDPAMFEAAVYAEHYGITLEEAVRRLELQNTGGIGELDAELSSKEAETFAGLWIEHQPEYRVVIVFTENGEETIKKYVEEDSPLADIIELRTFETTYEELKAAQLEAGQLLGELGLSVSSSVNIKENQVEVYVTDSKLFYNTLQEADAQLPEYVVVIITYEPLDEISFDINPDPSVNFPQLKMASGSYMMAQMMGDLVLGDGYLRVGGTLIIWQPDYFVHNNEGTIEILDRDGTVVGRVGEEIYMGGGEWGTRPADELLKEPLPEDIAGPFWIQGLGTRLNLNFSSDLFSLEVITSGEDEVYFLKRKPLLDEMARQEITLTGSWLVSYDGVLIKYPHIRVEAKPEENKGTARYTTFWPSDYNARINNSVFEILDASGSVVLRDGEEAELSGRVIYGYTPQLNDELPGGYSGPYLIVDSLSGGKN